MALTMKALFSSDFNVDDSTTTDEPFMHVLMLDHGATDTDRAGCARSELLFLSCSGSLPGEIAQRRVPPAGGITFHAGIAAAGSVNALVTDAGRILVLDISGRKRY